MDVNWNHLKPGHKKALLSREAFPDSVRYGRKAGWMQCIPRDSENKAIVEWRQKTWQRREQEGKGMQKR